jgi:hypothetical protein
VLVIGFVSAQLSDTIEQVGFVSKDPQLLTVPLASEHA